MYIQHIIVCILCNCPCNVYRLLHKIISTLKKYSCSVSTAQCEQVCFSGEQFPDVTIKRMVPIEGTTWVAMTRNCSHCYIARRLLGLVVSYFWWLFLLNNSLWFLCHLPPSAPSLCWPEISTYQRKMVSKALKSHHSQG